MMLDVFAKLLGIQPHRAEDVLHSERAARLVVSRRVFFGAAGAGLAAVALRPGELQAAMLTGRPFSFAQPGQLSSLHLIDQHGTILQRWYPGERVESILVTNDRPTPLYVRLVRVRNPTIPVFHFYIPSCLAFVDGCVWRPAQLPGVQYTPAPDYVVVA